MTVPRTLSCNEIVEMVTDYLEGDLDQPTTVALEEHLRLCPGCDRYVDQIRETVSTLGSITSESLSPQAQSGLLEAFRTFKQVGLSLRRERLGRDGTKRRYGLPDLIDIAVAARAQAQVFFQGGRGGLVEVTLEVVGDHFDDLIAAECVWDGHRLLLSRTRMVAPTTMQESDRSRR